MHFCCIASLLMIHRGGLSLSIIIWRNRGGGQASFCPGAQNFMTYHRVYNHPILSSFVTYHLVYNHPILSSFMTYHRVYNHPILSSFMTYHLVYSHPILASFMTYHRVNNQSNTTGATCGAGTAYPPGTPDFTPGF